jgi:CMP/dCMP kinase
MIIAVDGPAASGKGTLAKRLAEHFGFAHLDTGLLYRAVGFEVLRKGQDPSDAAAATAAAQSLDADTLNDPALRAELRGDAAASAASKVAVIKDVRQTLLNFQRAFAEAPPHGSGGALLDGRDIGTVVCPDALIKLFVTASVDVRAVRRVKELQERGLEAIYADVLRDMKERDARDSGRNVAPLAAADDAYVLDTSVLDADEVFAKAIEFIDRKKSSEQALES